MLQGAKCNTAGIDSLSPLIHWPWLLCSDRASKLKQTWVGKIKCFYLLCSPEARIPAVDIFSSDAPTWDKSRGGIRMCRRCSAASHSRRPLCSRSPAIHHSRRFRGSLGRAEALLGGPGQCVASRCLHWPEPLSKPRTNEAAASGADWFLTARRETGIVHGKWRWTEGRRPLLQQCVCVASELFISR